MYNKRITQKAVYVVRISPGHNGGGIINSYIASQVENGEEKILLARIEDLIREAERGREVRSDFLDLRQQFLVNLLLENTAGLRFSFFGGFDGAERKRLLLYPEWADEADDNISCVKLSVSGENSTKPGHRDYLGALLSLGIKRERMGDIVVQSNAAYVFADSDIAGFILYNLDRVKRSRVQAEFIDTAGFCGAEVEKRAIKVTVVSLRLDAVLAAAFKLSRTKAGQLIQGEKVRVNQHLIRKNNNELKVGDIISCRGYGRAEIHATGAISRKGRIHVELLLW